MLSLLNPCDGETKCREVNHCEPLYSLSPAEPVAFASVLALSACDVPSAVLKLLSSVAGGAYFSGSSPLASGSICVLGGIEKIIGSK